MSESGNVVAGGFLRERPAGQAATRKSGRLFLLPPLVLVNGAAIYGQAGWAYSNLAGGLVVAILFALAVESIGVYLAWESHEALMADQASAGLHLGSYSMGGLAGILNFLHFQPEGVPSAVAFGALSAISPWLWAVWSRARNRQRLAELGWADARGVKLSTSRKIWHPIRSLRVISWAAWEGVTSPQDAVLGWETSKLVTEPPAPAEPVVRRSAEETRALIAELREDEPGITQEEIAQRLGISSRRVREVLRAAA